MYHLLKLLTSHAGTTWSCESSGDGLSAYSSSGDVFTGYGSGANGLGNNNAWYRIQDPGNRREFVFQRVNSTTWIFRYSALDKFVGGSPSATVLPTATDQQGWGAGLNSTGVAMFAAGDFVFHIACDDSPEGNVYPFWYIGRVANTGTAKSAILVDALIDGTYPSEDLDPCAMIASSTSTILTDGVLGSRTSSQLVGWMRMNEVDEEFNRLTGLYLRDATGTITPDNMGRSPATNAYMTQPMVLRRGTGTHLGPKGQMRNVCYRPVSDIYRSLYYDGTYYYLLVDDVLIRGWPSSTLPIV